MKNISNSNNQVSPRLVRSEWRERIQSAMVEKAIATGKYATLIYEADQTLLPLGGLGNLFAATENPFSRSEGKKWAAVGRLFNETSLSAISLPSDLATLYELSFLPLDELIAKVADGTVTTKTTRSAAKRLKISSVGCPPGKAVRRSGSAVGRLLSRLVDENVDSWVEDDILELASHINSALEAIQERRALVQAELPVFRPE